MCQELQELAEKFAQYRKNRKQVRYPLYLWQEAIELCKNLPKERVAAALQVNIFSLKRHLKSQGKPILNPPAFIPIQISHPQPSIQLHIKGPLPMTIDFNRSTEEFAKLMVAIQGRASC
jgi:hypothetical protein